MKKKIGYMLLAFVGISVAYAIFQESRGTAQTARTAVKPSPAGQIVIARYCHSYARCQNCLKIEKYSREAIETNFRKELDSGMLRFETVNVEESANRHYVKDYGLYTKSLVLVAQAAGRETRYKVLNDVWNHLGDKDAFLDYVRKETEGFLK